jgi:LysR family nitrogen assimilation transcriptional regulator
MTFDLDTKSLRYFVAVALRGSFTLAAAHLRLSQSAVTKQILALERAYGVRLFQRRGHGITLTEAGQRLLQHARQIIEQVDATDMLLKQASARPMGRLTLGAPIATGELMLPAVIADYRRKYPDVYIHVVTGFSGDLFEQLAQGRIDLALVYGQPTKSGLEVCHLSSMELGLLAPARDGVRDSIAGRGRILFDEAAKLPLILPSASHTLRQLLEDTARSKGLSLNVILDSDSLPISKALVKAGVGYTFLNPNGALQELKSGELRYLAVEPSIEWSLCLATRNTKSASLAARLMIAEILERTGSTAAMQAIP